MPALRKLEVAGSPAAMGEAFGEQMREEVRQLAESRIRHLAEFVASHDPPRRVERQEILGLARRTVDAHKSYSPAIWAEFEGIARAAGVSVEELLIGNGYTDFRDYALAGAKKTPEAFPGGCTAFLLPAALAGGHPVVGQTWDMNPDARPFLLVLRRRPEGQPETVSVTTAGCLCLIGMNSAGVAVGNTNLAAADARPGVNYLFTITRALQCRSAGEAADAIEATARLSGHNFYVADERDAINVEASATKAERTVVEAEAFVHANHFVSDSLKAFEASRGLANSRWRHERLRGNLDSLTAPIGMDDCWAQLADNTRGAGAICNEDYDGAFGPAATLATVVQCPGQRRLYVCDGGARLGGRELLTI